MRLPVLVHSSREELTSSHALLALCAAVANNAVRQLFFAQSDARLASHKILNSSFGTWAGVSLKAEEDILKGIICESKSTKRMATSVFLPGYDFWDYEKMLRKRAVTPLPVSGGNYGVGTSGLGDTWNRTNREKVRQKLSNWTTEKSRVAGQTARLLAMQKEEASASPQERYNQLRQQRQELAEKKDIELERKEAQIMKAMKEDRETRRMVKDEQDEEQRRLAERVYNVRRETAAVKQEVHRKEVERVKNRRIFMEFSARCNKIVDDEKICAKHEMALALAKKQRHKQHDFCRDDLLRAREARREQVRQSRKEVKAREHQNFVNNKDFVEGKREELRVERQETKNKRLTKEEDDAINRQSCAASRKKERDNALAFSKESKEAWTAEKRETLLIRKKLTRSTTPAAQTMSRRSVFSPIPVAV